MTPWSLFCALHCQDLVVLGHCCSCVTSTNEMRCTEVAAWRVYWPGREPSLQCERHKRWTAHVAATLGFVLQAEPVTFRDWPERDAIDLLVENLEMT